LGSSSTNWTPRTVTMCYVAPVRPAGSTGTSRA
jgi:hypothetical protein